MAKKQISNKIKVLLLASAIILLPISTRASSNVMPHKEYYTDYWTEINQSDLEGVPIARTPGAYLSALLYLDVENNYRYEPKAVVTINGQTTRMSYADYAYWKDVLKINLQSKETYCNIFAIDACKLLKCPIPRDLAENLFVWFKTANGWKADTKVEAIANANKGLPTVMVMAYPGQIGHIAMVRPSTDGLHVVQAGSTCSNNLSFDRDVNSHLCYYTYIKN